MPSKGSEDKSQIKAMIDNLRVEHFKLGEEQSYKSKSSNAVGGAASSAKKPVAAPWAHLRTNYGLGIDNPQKVTDSAARFADTKSAFRSGSVVSPFDDNKKNKAKNNDLDSIVIAGNNFFDSTVSSKTQFRDTLNASRKMNTGLDPLTQSYI